MKKAETFNVFNGGLVMDINPLVAPNNILCNALNATITTMQGNENVLQNDMGNGRVETAYLPEGYVPIGTAELGGIIYIVSYNPLIDKCQIGSFPSPERNITCDEIQTSNTEVNNTQFQVVENGRVILNKTLLKVNLLSESSSENNIGKLNPGDKYTIYSTNVRSNKECLSDCKKEDPNKVDTTPRYITIHVVSIGEDGKITYLDNSIKWTQNNDIEYYIKEIESIQEERIQKDIDSYRSLVSSAYNIFNSKVSGKLALLFEVKVIDSFQVTWDATVSNSEGNNLADIDFYINWSSSHSDINPYCLVLSKSELSNNIETENAKEGYGKIINVPNDRKNDGTDQNVLVNVGTFKYNPNLLLENYIWKYTVVPAMLFGEIPYLAKSGSINFSEIGSGKMEIDEWRYYIQENNFYINLGLNAYPEKGKFIDKLVLTFIPFESILTENILVGSTSEKDFELYSQYSQYTMSGRSSYSGYFQEIINFKNDSRITNNGILKNYLYLVDIGIVYGNASNLEIRHNYKWLYTTGQWNQVFLDGKEMDFNNLFLTDYIKFEPTFQVTDSIQEIYKNTELTIPEELPTTNLEMNYATLGAKIATVNYDYNTHTFNESKESISVNIQVSPIDYKELFKLNLQSQDYFTNTISEKTITHDTFDVESDQTSLIDSYIESKVMSNEIAKENLLLALSQIDQESSIKSEEINNYAIDSFDANILSGKNNNSFTINVYGAIFSRINADLEKTKVQVEQTIRPILLYKNEYTSLGIKDSNNLEVVFGFGQRRNVGGHSTGFTSYKYDSSDGSTPIDNVSSYDGRGDGPTYVNYWESYSYNRDLNPWMLSQNCPFTLVKYSPSRGSTSWYDVKSGRHDISKKWGIWVKTDEQHYIPIHTFYEDNELPLAMKHIILLLSQVYYVQQNTSNIEKCIVYNINRLKTFQEIWNIKLDSQLTFENITKSLHLIAQDKREIPLNSLIQRCSLFGISTNNIIHKDTQVNLGYKNISHSFRINTIDLYLEYEKLKSTSMPSMWEITSLDKPIIGNSKNPNYFYVYDPVSNDMLNLNDPTNCRYISLGGSINDTSQNGRIKVLINGETGKDTTLFRYLKINDEGDLVAKESNILSKAYTYKYWPPDDGEETTIKNNSQISFIYGV